MSDQSNRRRARRSPEQIIAGLESKIKDVRARAASRAAKKTEPVKLAIIAIRTMDKGMDIAIAEGDSKLRQAFAESRKILADHLTNTGVKAPQKRRPRGPKPS
jgi:hypothetical protein